MRCVHFNGRQTACIFGTLVWAVLANFHAAVGQGIYISSSGPVNRGMGGASTAAPVDAIGAMYWNPATISGLEHSELEIGMDMMYSEHELASSFGPFTGVTNSDNGVTPIPSVAWVHHMSNPAVSFGFSMGGVGGFKTNVPSDLTNPVLLPQPLGLGTVGAEAAFMEMNPVLSIALNENFSVAVGPIAAIGQIELDPFFGDAPNANGYPSGRMTRYHWGGGFQAGAYYITESQWHFGASVKSPIWFEQFRFFSEDALGASRILHLDLELPLIASLGAAYSGVPDWIFAADVRYFDYENTEGFGEPTTFAPNFALNGLGWDSVVSLSLGAQRRVTDSLYLRGGYTFCDSPIDDAESFFNTLSPLIYQHLLGAGLSYQLSECVAVNLGYTYYLPADVTGPIFTPTNVAIPGTSVTNSLEAHIASLGVSARY